MATHLLLITVERGKYTTGDTVVVDLGTDDPEVAIQLARLELLGDLTEMFVWTDGSVNYESDGGRLWGEETVVSAKIVRVESMLPINLDGLRAELDAAKTFAKQKHDGDQDRAEFERLKKKFA